MQKAPEDLKASTISSRFVVEMLQGAKSRGLDTRQILREASISSEILEVPRSRITFTQFSSLSRSLARLLRDETYGLTHQPQHPGTYRLICFSVMNAGTVGEAIEIYRSFINILDNSFRLDLTAEGGQATLRLQRLPGRQILNSFAIEHLFLTLYRTICWLANAQIPIVRVDLDYAPPAHEAEYGYIFYKAPVVFDQAAPAMIFSEKSLDLPNLRNRSDLNDFTKDTSLRLLSQTYNSDNYSMRVRLWLSKMLMQENYAPDIETAADHFRLHPQALRRKLKKEGSYYNEIKTEARRDMAINLISHKTDTVESIAFQLGFSESRAFVRAFKSWTGLTPLAYRKMSNQL